MRRAGHEVFIDADIPLGTDWSAEIAGRIQWCDYLVVLLSEDLIDSEMVQGEIRLARHYRREDGSPYIFPIRVRYEGGLDYELTSYLGRLQHILWKDADDDLPWSSAILAAARPNRGLAEAHCCRHVRPDPCARLMSNARGPPSIALPCFGPRAPLGWKIGITSSGRRMNPIGRLATSNGETLVIKGARQMGKSSLLVRYVTAAKQAGKRVAFLDFQGMSDAQLAEYPAFLQRVTSVLLRRLELPTDGLPPIRVRAGRDRSRGDTHPGSRR